MLVPKLPFRSFEGKIAYFNYMYKLPAPSKPTTNAVVAFTVDRCIANGVPVEEAKATPRNEYLIHILQGFIKTMQDEIKEGEDIINKLAENSYTNPVDFLTDMADWLGDMQIYCASEMAKYGLPNKEVLSLIMDSNFSKLQADGSVLYDSNGKVQKGPFYWKPEPSLKLLIEDTMFEAEAEQLQKRESNKYD